MKKVRGFRRSDLYRSLAFLQAIIFVLLSFSISASAENVASSVAVDGEIQQSAFVPKEGDLTYSQLQQLRPEDVALPETIERSDAIERELVNRLYAQEESLNTAVFQTRHGTKSAYVFDQPIKYTTVDGEVKDKSTALSPTGVLGYVYAMTENSFQAYFGATASNGVLLRYGEYYLSMIPESSLLVSTPKLGQDARSVIYQGAFGANTALRYTTQLAGVKEDIVLLSNVGKYNFRFLLSLGGLVPKQTASGRWILTNEQGDMITSFGNIVINDSAGHSTLGSLNIVPRSDGKYMITVEVPSEFLQSSSTVYPVYIDPTLTINEGGTTPTYIHDYGVYTDQTFYNDAQMLPYEHFVSQAYGKVIYKLLDFSHPNGRFYELDEYGIGRVTLYAKSYSNVNCNLIARPMVRDCGNTANCYLDDELFGASVSDNSSSTPNEVALNGTLSVDITEIARGWTRYNRGLSNALYENPANGFILSQELTGASLGDVYIAATEDTGNSNVYYTVDYSETYGLVRFQNRHSSGVKYLSVNSNYQESASSYSVSLLQNPASYKNGFIFKYDGEGKYLIFPMYHPGCALAQNGRVQNMPAVLTDSYRWYITVQSGQGDCLIKNCNNGKIFTRYLSSDTVTMAEEQQALTLDHFSPKWYIFPIQGFGSQQYRRLSSSEVGDINCQGYAMMRNDEPFDYTINMSATETQINSEYRDVISDLETEEELENVLSEMKQAYSMEADQKFQEWLNDNGYVFVAETTFSRNGENRALNSNQYRVVLRIGGYLFDWGDFLGGSFDYHFWYQTSDGRWANKLSTFEPYLLSYGTVPSTDDSPGWYNNHGETFYDSDIYSYIITVPES